MPNLLSDTIAAMITPAGVGGVSMVRVSGSNARELAAKIVSGLDIVNAAANSIHYAKIIDTSGFIVDDVLVSIFHSPHSYTGDDVVEIGCHGNPIVVQAILQLLIQSGARLAEPGEFTKRAFLNGRIDLTQAEAVADLIVANSDAAIQIAHRQLFGELGNRIKSIAVELVSIIGIIELELDFVEEGIQLADPITISKRLEGIIESLERFIQTYNQGKLFAHGIQVAIIGKPNVGKSSLLNKLAGEERAIVSPIPGTTRDTINISLQHNGIRIEFWDTAGLRAASEQIEQIGIERTHNQIEKSDLILEILDATSSDISDQLLDKSSNVRDNNRILVLNKLDLVEHESTNFPELSQQKILKISAKTGRGIQQLLDAIIENSLPDFNHQTEEVSITNARHFDCLIRAKQSLQKAAASVSVSSGEFISVDLRQALNAISEITGQVTSQQILESIFANFCIGK